MHRHIGAHTALTFLAMLSMTACTEVAGPHNGPSAAPATMNPQPTLGNTDIPTLDRYRIAVRTDGPIRAGTPLRIVVEGVANIPSPATEVSVTLPEVTLTNMAARPEEFSYRVGTPLLPSFRRTVSGLTRGGAVRGDFVVHVPAPGYYRVVAVMRPTVDAGHRFAGHSLRNSASEELWLLVTDSVGRVLPTFDPALIPPGFVRSPGPFRRHARTMSRRDGGDIQAALVSDQISWRVRYYNQYAGAYQPVAGAVYSLDACSRPLYKFTCDDEDFTRIDGGATDPNGYIYFACNYDEYQLNVSTSAGTYRFQVVNGGNAVRSDMQADCGGLFEMVLPSSQSHLFLEMNRVWNGAATHFGATRSALSIEVVTSGGSRYSPSTDRVYIETADIWGGADRLAFTAGHEYGHAFHQKGLGGNEGSGSCPDPHFLDAESNLQCAYSEGFANYVATAIRADLVTFSYRSLIEADSYFPGCIQRASTYPYACYGVSYDGSVIEGAFAAFLYDITDSSAEQHDLMAATGSYVRDLVLSCKVQYSWILRRANGTDELVYCAENAINPSGYLTRRGAYPVAYSEAAVEPAGWTSSAIHTNWVWNMYEKR